MMSKMPTTIKSPAAVVVAIPWSCAEGMKWMPIRPFVVAPQIANAPAKAQKDLVRAACRSALSAKAAASPVVGVGSMSRSPP